ncbi:hypothetical protein ACP275_04G071200 [Erythranthe tilingii]
MEFLSFSVTEIRLEVEAMSFSRSKSKDKKAGKEPQKGSSKPSGHTNTSGGIPASGYNPFLGTFHTLEPAPVPSASPLLGNGRFGKIDDTDDHNGIECDSVSNNGSWSGESEDLKEKTSQPPSRQESVPGADNDKREKVRQKNERKHQRQKERRAQELHERCRGYLMSRKLEALSQQLVAMGFTQERATMALMLNEGRVEQSVAWLFEGNEEDKRIERNLEGGGNLKIDISEELLRITDMEIRYKASKQEVERAIVSCEGDVEQAEETLKSQKQEPPKLEETGDPLNAANGKLPMAIIQNATRVQTKATPSAIIQQKRDERDFNYTKVPITVGPSVDLGTKNIQPLKKVPSKTQQSTVPADKRGPSSASYPPVSSSLAPPVQVSSSHPPATRFLSVGNELKNLQLGSVREPVTVMQRPQSINAKQVANPSSSVSPSPPPPPPPQAAMGWYPSSVDSMKSSVLVPPVTVSTSLSPINVNPNPNPNPNANPNPMYSPFHYQPQQQFVPNSSSSSVVDSQGTTIRGSGLWSRGGASPPLCVASSLGLFSGLGSSGSSSPVDWNTGSSMLEFDYTNIDWSLDAGGSTLRPSGLWGGGGGSSYSLQSNARSYDSFGYGSMGVMSGMRPVLSSGGGVSIPGLQEGGVGVEPTGGGSREWTSAFEERDLFSLPRQFVSSPSL